MFKRFFIGLIILSALTSEGAVVLQKNYSDLLLYVQIESGIFNGISSALNTGTEKNDSLFIYNKLSCDSLKFESDKERYKCKNWFKNFEASYYIEHLLPSFNMTGGSYTYAQGREPIIKGTDSSPPLL